jgi:hypothetical protein
MISAIYVVVNIYKY